MRTPLIADTNKLSDDLVDIFMERTEILNRIQFIRLSNETIDKINEYKRKNLVIDEYTAVENLIKSFPLTPDQFRRFVDVIRRVPVEVDVDKVTTICNTLKQIMPEHLKYWNIDEIGLYYARALAKVDVVIHNEEIPDVITPHSRVYDLLEKVLARFLNDLNDMFGGSGSTNW